METGRAAFDRGAWREAYVALRAADEQHPLEPDDLDRLATAAYLIGEEDVGVQARGRAHAAFLDRGDRQRAAHSAVWLAFALLDKPSQQAQAAGWLARAQRLVEDVSEPCVEQGWLLCAAARQYVASGDIASAHAAATQAAAIGVRFGDADLTALARHAQGRTMLALNDTAGGIRLLDEVMVSVTGGEIGPMVAGIVYCSVISACLDMFDLRRAQEWTDALHRWCVSAPELMPFRGSCLIRRSELMQLHGSWEQALSEVQRARDRLGEPASRPEAGAAFYQMAELHRLRGEFTEAEAAYRMASQAGRKPHPGLALLRLRQGQTDAADASIRLALQEARFGRARVLMLNAAVDIMLAKHDLSGAAATSEELAQLASQLDTPFLTALSAHARGAVAVCRNDALGALEWLQRASVVWQDLDAPYELAQTRVLIGRAYRQLGDAEGAQLEFDAAHETFERLGAAPDIAMIASLAVPSPPADSTGLTGREIEVLRLIATGATNRTIAGRLGISEKTVARHISNIFTKLDLPSRAAATAYAYQHKLL